MSVYEGKSLVHLLVTVEENAIQGGAGSAVSEYLSQTGVVMPILQLGLPDRYIDHGKHADLLAAEGLDARGIESAIHKRMELLLDGKQSAAL